MSSSSADAEKDADDEDAEIDQTKLDATIASYYNDVDYKSIPPYV